MSVGLLYKSRKSKNLSKLRLNFKSFKPDWNVQNILLVSFSNDNFYSFFITHDRTKTYPSLVLKTLTSNHVIFRCQRCDSKHATNAIKISSSYRIKVTFSLSSFQMTWTLPQNRTQMHCSITGSKCDKISLSLKPFLTSQGKSAIHPRYR